MSKRKVTKKNTNAVKNIIRNPLCAKNKTQREYIQAILGESEMVMCTGPAGTGKTYIPVVLAADMYVKGTINKIVMSRPNVPAGRSLGHFPGSLEEKMGEWVTTFLIILKERLGQGALDCAIRNGNIEFIPFETMRGRTFDDSFIILDESQNTTQDEIKMFLTRLGENSKTLIIGDIDQSDLGSLGPDNGLAMAADMVDYYDMPIDLIEFSSEEVVRSEICKMWVMAFEDTLDHEEEETPMKEMSFMSQSKHSA